MDLGSRYGNKGFVIWAWAFTMGFFNAQADAKTQECSRQQYLIPILERLTSILRPQPSPEALNPKPEEARSFKR